MNDTLKALSGVLTSVAPTLATMLLGPMGGAAVSALESAFGLSAGSGADAITKVVQAGGMTPEIMANVRAADQKHAEIMGQQGIDLAKLNADHEAAQAVASVDNTKDARDMQKVTRSNVPALLAVLITVGFFGILVGMLAGVLTATDNQALLIMLGALGAAWGAVVNYFFGSSAGSSEKTRMLAQAQPINLK